MLVVINAEALEIIATLIAVGGELHGAVMKLFVNDYVPTRNTLAADLTVATFDGYATSAAIVWGAPFLDGNGYATVIGPTVQFTCTGSTVIQTVFGYWLEEAGGNVICAERFANSIPITGAGSAVVVVPEFTVISQQT